MFYAERTTKKSMAPSNHDMARLVAEKKKVDQVVNVVVVNTIAARNVIDAGEKSITLTVKLLNIVNVESLPRGRGNERKATDKSTLRWTLKMAS